MKKSKISLVIFGFILMFISISTMLILNSKDINTIFIVEENSAAHKYAKDNNISVELVSDSVKNDYIKRIELFKYSEVEDGIEIIGYDGISKELVIPRSINGKKVISIKKDAFVNIEKLIISENVKNIDISILENTTLVCYKNDLCNNSDIETEIILDSEKNNYNFNDIVVDFEYNIKDNKIEITKYNNTNDIIIPISINGYNVEKLSINLENVDSIYIPNTVLSFEFVDLSDYDSVSIIISVLTFIIYSLIILFVFGKNKFNSIPVFIISILYLIGLLVYSFYSQYNNYSNRVLVIIYIILTLIYIFISISLIFAKKKIENYDTKVKNSGEFIRKCIDIIIEMKDKNLDLYSLEETVKYSDPVSSLDTENIEKQIIELLNCAETQDEINKIEKLVIKRNKICKESK